MSFCDLTMSLGRVLCALTDHGVRGLCTVGACEEKVIVISASENRADFGGQSEHLVILLLAVGYEVGG